MKEHFQDQYKPKGSFGNTMEEKISTGVMKTAQFSNAVYYQVGCSCQDKDCNMTLELEVHDGIMFLNLYKDLAVSVYWQDDGFFKKLWRRIKYAARIFFTGYIKLEESHVLQGEDQINNFIAALQEGKELLKNGQ